MSPQPCRTEDPVSSTEDVLDGIDLQVTTTGRPDPRPVRKEAASSDLPTPSDTRPALVGECTDDRHPTLMGRVRVRWSAGNGETCEQWVPALHGLTIREADRVLLQHPSNWPEPIVVGVVDGFAVRPETARVPGPQISLAGYEALCISTVDGAKLLEVYHDESGPVVRLLQEDVHLDLPGKLHIDAKSIELEAKMGGITIKAKDDVVVQGEMIDLN